MADFKPLLQVVVVGIAPVNRRERALQAALLWAATSPGARPAEVEKAADSFLAWLKTNPPATPPIQML